MSFIIFVSSFFSIFNKSHNFFLRKFYNENKYILIFSSIVIGLRILGFPCNQFLNQMPESDGDEMVCHLQKEKADFGDVFAKVSSFLLCSSVNCMRIVIKGDL